jgi:hypothetical protein
MTRRYPSHPAFLMGKLPQFAVLGVSLFHSLENKLTLNVSGYDANLDFCTQYAATGVFTGYYCLSGSQFTTFAFGGSDDTWQAFFRMAALVQIRWQSSDRVTAAATNSLAITSGSNPGSIASLATPTLTSNPGSIASLTTSTPTSNPGSIASLTTPTPISNIGSPTATNLSSAGIPPGVEAGIAVAVAVAVVSLLALLLVLIRRRKAVPKPALHGLYGHDGKPELEASIFGSQLGGPAELVGSRQPDLDGERGRPAELDSAAMPVEISLTEPPELIGVAR